LVRIARPSQRKASRNVLGRAIRTNRVVTALLLAIGASLVTTFVIVTNRDTGVAADADTVLWLLVLNLTLFGALALAFLYRLIDVWIRRRRGVAGSRLYMRLIVFFSVLVAVPSILVASFAAIFFYYGVQDWFNDRVRTSVEESLNVAEAYLAEHQQVIRADALAMANDLNREAPALMLNARRLDQALQTQTLIRNLTEAVIFDSTGQVIAKSGLTFALEFETVPDDALVQARAGEVPVVTSNTDDRVRALVRLNQFVDAYLYVGRFIDPAVLGHMEAARDAVEGYAALEERRGNLIAVMTLLFIGAALLLLLVAIGLALKFASWLAVPLGQLIQASDRVSGGDYGVRVAEPAHMDELSILSRTFNRMTSQLEEQRDELVEANRKMDRRRRFTETVLSGVSAGIISIDSTGQVRLANRRATEFLTGDTQISVTGNIFDLLPGLAVMTERARLVPQRDVEQELDVARPQGQAGDRATLLVRISAELQEAEITGFIITFDDITDLVFAQRTAAWADVARRIAHEIKNPLTPIQLAAELLRRRYGELVPANDGTFDTCIDTIIRQVGDIGGMVDEFSSFARMPQP
ncbi:MAG: histidine kinase dimerization/phospho-acceptor domain-containing protein, partial [Pseudomonadota bacterium]